MSICLMCFSKLERLLVMMNKEGMQTKYHAFIIQVMSKTKKNSKETSKQKPETTHNSYSGGILTEVCIHIKNRISTIFLLHFSAG